MNLITLTPEISTIISQIADIYRYHLKDRKASGKLEDFTTDVEIDENKFRIIFNLEEYWKYVEYGRGPGKMPPISKIEEWIRIKPIVPNAVDGKVPDTRQLAFMIARKIGRVGTPAFYPLHTTLTSQDTEILISAIKQEILKQIAKYITSDEIGD